MRPNHAFQRAISGLTHPLSIAAIVILLFNDHWLRWHYPSWLTGKLGDFAWLVFAPFIAALVFSWLIPRHLKQHESVVGIISFALIGLWFVLGKTEPTVHRLTVSLLETLMNWDDTLRMDVTDLLMLPGLLVGYWIWGHAKTTSLRTQPAVYVACALGIMATLANSPPPSDFGIECIGVINDELITINGGYKLPRVLYSSKDGGMTWQQNNSQDLSTTISKLFEQCRETTRNQPLILENVANPEIQYRFQKAQSIDRSVDGGQTWTLEIDLSELNKDVRRYYQGQKAVALRADVIADPGPFSAVIDSDTGNLVVAMGFEGILVRTPQGQWNWIDIGPYHRENIYRFDRILDLLKGELILAGILMLLIFASALQLRKSGFSMLLLSISWIFWIMGVWIPLPKWGDGSFLGFGIITFFTNILTAIFGLLFVAGTIANILDQKISAKQVKETLFLSTGSAILFLFPYLLWSQGTIPTYSTASVFGLLLGLSAAVGTGQYLKRRYPTIIPAQTPET